MGHAEACILSRTFRDTSTRPKHVTNWEGKVVLGYLEDGDETNEHLNFGELSLNSIPNVTADRNTQ